MEKKRSAMEVFKEQNVMEEDYNMVDMPVEQNAGLPLSSVMNEMPQDKQMQMPSLNQPIQRQEAKKMKKNPGFPINMIKTSEEMQLEKEPLKVQITGRWFWKRVIVPPNAYLVHTRIHKKEPVTIGLGISFRYKPNKDAYLIVPAAMQTIGVVANCISKEKQGINILAYVQWQIDDFAQAYKKLDFSDSRDPLGIVNAQLREQAEAAIKDKISTMIVEEVLTDKAPIIEELTARLKQVAEGQGQASNEGLGIKIATVQIREAIVCSHTLWDNLQSPYRHEQNKKANISLLEMQDEISRKELFTRKERETREAETNLEIETTRQKKLTEALELQMNEESARYKKEQEVTQDKLKQEEQTLLSQKEMQERMLATESQMTQKRELEFLKQAEIKKAEEERIAFEAEKRRLNIEAEQKLFKNSEEVRFKDAVYKLKITQLDLEKTLAEKESDLNLLVQTNREKIEKLMLESALSRQEAQQKVNFNFENEKNRLEFIYREQEVKLDKMRQEIRNLMNTHDIFSQLITAMPEIAAKMPEIKELKIFQSDKSEPLLDSLTNFLHKMFAVSESLGIKLPLKKETIDQIKEGKG